MKNNKKIMSVVAGVCIASQLLTIGSVIANAQTTTVKQHTHESNDNIYHYGNVVDIYTKNLKSGVNIKFNIKAGQLYVTTTGSKTDPFISTDSDSANKDYLTLRLVNGNGGVKQEYTFKGNDPVEKVVKIFDNMKFSIGDGLQIYINKEVLGITDYDKKDPHVTISGFVDGTGRCFVDGASEDFLKVATFVIRSNKLEYKQYTNKQL